MNLKRTPSGGPGGHLLTAPITIRQEMNYCPLFPPPFLCSLHCGVCALTMFVFYWLIRWYLLNHCNLPVHCWKQPADRIFAYRVEKAGRPVDIRIAINLSYTGQPLALHGKCSQNRKSQCQIWSRANHIQTRNQFLLWLDLGGVQRGCLDERPNDGPT